MINYQRIAPLLAVFFLGVAPGLAAGPSPTAIPRYEPSFLLLRDTLFVLDSTYLEVRLDRQQIIQHFRDGRTRRFPCSTGNPSIKDGIATREGIFTIQWKSRKYMSKQFEVPLNFWMPFDGGIGMHGLQGRSYYRFLGRRASSHGCVRISNETGAVLFRDTRRGTAVFVHSGSPARVLAFGDTARGGMRVLDEIEIGLLRARLDAVEDSRAEDTLLLGRLALRPGRAYAVRVGVGRVDQRRVSQRTIATLSPPPVVLRARREVLTAIPELRRKRTGTAQDLISQRD